MGNRRAGPQSDQHAVVDQIGGCFGGSLLLCHHVDFH
jgi:hypothetical protein